MTDFDHELRARIPRVLVEVVPGEPLHVSVPILDSADDPVPVAGAWSARLQLRRQWTSTEILHHFTPDDGSAAVTSGAAGSVILTATAAQTAQWQADWETSPPQAVGDLWVTDDTGTPHCLCDLVLALLPRTTRED